MSNLTKIAVDAMGGDGSPKKIIDGIIHSHKSNKKNFFTKILLWIEKNLFSSKYRLFDIYINFPQITPFNLIQKWNKIES